MLSLKLAVLCLSACCLVLAEAERDAPVSEIAEESCEPERCGMPAHCKSNLVCSCLMGCTDISAAFNLGAGSKCKKCDSLFGVDLVILLDTSGSLRRDGRLAFNRFIENVIDFIFRRQRDNRIAIVPFADRAIVGVPLTDNAEQLKDFLNATLWNPDMVGVNTNTAKALYVANKEIYAIESLPSDGTRERITLLLTDGAPSICNAYRDRSASDYVEIAPGINEDTKLADCFKAELTATRTEMVDTHEAQLVAMYVGKRTDADWDAMRLIAPGAVIYNDNFEGLLSRGLAQLQNKIC